MPSARQGIGQEGCHCRAFDRTKVAAQHADGGIAQVIVRVRGQITHAKLSLSSVPPAPDPAVVFQCACMSRSERNCADRAVPHPPSADRNVPADTRIVAQLTIGTGAPAAQVASFQNRASMVLTSRDGRHPGLQAAHAPRQETVVPSSVAQLPEGATTPAAHGALFRQGATMTAAQGQRGGRQRQMARAHR